MAKRRNALAVVDPSPVLPDSIQQRFEAAWAIVSQLPEDWQVAIWNPMIELVPEIKQLLEVIHRQQGDLDGLSRALDHSDNLYRDAIDRLQQAQSRSTESLIAEGTIQLDVSAHTLQTFLGVIKGDYAGLLGSYRMQDVEDFINEIAGDVADYQRKLDAEYAQMEPGFDPEDDYQ